MEGTPFYEFPKTPHMAGSTVVDDDEVISDAQVHSIPAETVLTHLLDHYLH